MPGRDRYDVVVIGSGLGGLTAAAFLAHEGRSVLVVERQAGAGGCAHSFRRGPYHFDPANHITTEARAGRFQVGRMDRIGEFLVGLSRPEI